MSILFDVLLIVFYFTLFAVIHSILASLPVKIFFKKKFGNKIALYRFFYNLFSTITFLLFLYFSPKPYQLVYELTYPFDLIIVGLQIAAIFGLLWTIKYVDVMDFIGIRQMIQYQQGNYSYDLDEKNNLITVGPFKLVRHPIYFFSILILLLRPYMTVFYFIVTICCIIYFYVGSIFEEKKLEKIYGEEYLKYKNSVSRIFPVKWLVKGIKMKKGIILFILITLFSSEISLAQSKDSILVDLGNKKITVDEFVTRFEFTPWPRRNIRFIDDELKYEFLKTLIAEKLLSIFGEEIKIDTSFDLSEAYKNLEKMIVRDALYRKEIMNKVTFDKDDLNNAIARSQITLFVRYIFSQDSSEIKNLYEQLKNGIPFDTFYTQQINSGYENYPMEVTYGTLIEEAEDKIYRTEPKYFTSPVKANLGYYIFYVDSSRMAINLGPKEFNESIRKAEKILKQRIEEKLYQEYFRKFFSKKRGEADGEVFWMLVNQIAIRFKYKMENQQPVRGNQFIIDPEDVREIEKNLGDDKNLILVKLEKKNVPVKEFLRYILFKGFTLTDSSTSYIAARLNKAIRTFLEDEYLAEEGYRQGLQFKPEVKKDIEMWKDFYYANWYSLTLKNQIEVSEKEIVDYIKNKSIKSEEVVLVNIQEILVDSLDKVELILNKLKDGEDFGELAKKYSLRKWAAEKNGEFGFFPTSMYGNIGKTAERMNVGEIFAPIETENGFSIIKLLDKKIERPDSMKIENYEVLKEKINAELKQKKFDSERDKLVANLAQKYVRNINYDLLKSIKVNQLNMFVYRYMGFGGKMTAVPIISPYISWYEEWKKINKSLP